MGAHSLREPLAGDIPLRTIGTYEAGICGVEERDRHRVLPGAERDIRAVVGLESVTHDGPGGSISQEDPCPMIGYGWLR